jgi:hypothetical protein
VYFYKVDNHYHGRDPNHYIDMWLFKINLGESRNPKKKVLLRWADYQLKEKVV